MEFTSENFLISSGLLLGFELIKMDKKDPSHRDSIDCKCKNCQRKFGGLPLLVQVIEQQSQPQPSTSQERSPRSSSSSSSFTCQQCVKSFGHKGDYKKHLRKHTGEQPFSCSVCERRFAHTSNLSRHMRLHTGDKPFMCEVCRKEFSRKDKLELHKRNCKGTR